MPSSALLSTMPFQYYPETGDLAFRGYIIQEINENLTYDYLHSSEENLWSVLYLTGYLTCLKDDTAFSPCPSIALVIPNAEIREIFETTIIQWFDDSARSWNRKPLFDAIWAKTVLLPPKK